MRYQIEMLDRHSLDMSQKIGFFDIACPILVCNLCETRKFMLAESAVHYVADCLHRSPFGGGVGARIYVEGHRSAGMSEDRAYCLDVYALRDCVGREGVTEVVEGRAPALCAYEAH